MLYNSIRNFIGGLILVVRSSVALNVMIYPCGGVRCKVTNDMVKLKRVL
jgi:hypothetical protein